MRVSRGIGDISKRHLGLGSYPISSDHEVQKKGFKKARGLGERHRGVQGSGSRVFKFTLPASSVSAMLQNVSRGSSAS